MGFSVLFFLTVYSSPLLENFIYIVEQHVLCSAGNHQICRLGNQQHSLHCQWDQPVRYHRGDIFENVEYVQVCA